jgi:aquaporin Z
MGAEAPAYSKYIAEFVGTFLLVFTVGCNVSKGDSTWAGTSIACVLMVSIYALGGISGANFNPAVSLALALSTQLPWVTAGIYMAVQLIAGICAGLSYLALYGDSFNLAPAGDYGIMQAGMAELLYTFMLCFVVLNVACSVKSGNSPNQFYGLAIGFVIVAGAYGAGNISGGCFNPAVAFGIDVSSAHKGFGYSFVYLIFELLGAALASGLHRVVRPQEYALSVGSLASSLTSEFLGTFFLVLTVGLNVTHKSPAGAFSIAASLMCMIYALGNVSGAHFNPAVTIAIFLSGRGKAGGLAKAGMYMGVQILGGIFAGLCYAGLTGQAFPLGPGDNKKTGDKFAWGQVAFAEFMFTFVLCFVVLSVATTKVPSKDMFGLAIGSCVTVGGCGIGAVSGGSLNPAVSFGIDAADLVKGGWFSNCIAYSAFEISGAAVAALVFYATHPSEYRKDPYGNF